MAAVREVRVGPVRVGGGAPLALIAGPCVIESREQALAAAREVRAIAEKAGFPLVFKASFDKGNRTSVRSFRGPGIDEGLDILAQVKRETGLPVTSDVHSPEQCARCAGVLDLLQVPAFLCRQTDLLAAAAATGLPVNVKKGQFLAPWDVAGIVGKVRGGEGLLVTERGATFGYNNLVVDFRSFPTVRGLGVPVVYDATHSLQLPGGLGDSTGGMREMIPYLARAAAACGIDALFMEVHPDPDRAPCDGPNMWPTSRLPALLAQVRKAAAAAEGEA